MKYLVILSIALFSFTSIQAQEKSDKKNVETSFEVKGVCGQCEDRIESAAMRTKGVKVADWDKKTQLLTVVYNKNKTSEEEIHQAVADRGHETSMVPSDSTAYSKLPGCCRYKDGAKCAD